MARNEEFQTLAQDIAMQVAAIDPLYISVVDIPVNELDKQREIFMAEMAEENKPEEIKNKIIEGKLNKWYSEVCLMNQAFFKDEDKTIAELLEEKIAKIGEKIVVKRMTRYHIS